MQIISIALGIYSFIIFVRIVLTWFQGSDFGRVQEYLARITDPYLNWFRQFDFLRIAGIDFSIIAGLITLWIARSIAVNIAYAGTISFGLILAIVLTAIAGAVFFFLTLFLILAVIRLLGSLFGANTALRFWIVVDQIVEPIVHKVVIPLAKGRFVSYQNALIIFSAVDLVVIIAGRFLVDVLAGMLAGLPF
ncbi:MAG: YggT family protein [Spirochaetota bacterium]